MPFWDLASVVAKLAGLIAMAGVVGGSFGFYLASPLDGSLRRRILSYVLLSAVVGVLVTALFFFIQVGAINQSGWHGMWDGQMAGILAQSGLGSAVGFRLLGYVSALGMLIVLWGRGRYTILAPGLFVAACILLGISFPLTGHVATLGLLAQGAIVLHVLSVFLWIGALYPLWLFCAMQSTERLKGTMQRFGWMAMFIVTLLLLSGVYLSIQLLDSLDALLSTRYGQSLSLKLLGVSGLLALAGINKFFLVPRLETGKPAAPLKRSITLEMGVALVVLSVTAYLTTVVDIPHG